jgi:colanic acid biosynthesis glycosyl transferase WcaI
VSRLRILLLVLQFPPDVNSTGLLLAQVGEGLVACGHDVSVITTFPHYDRFQIWPEYRGRIRERATLRGMDVTRLWVYTLGSKQRMGHRLLSYLSYNLLATLAAVTARRHFDVILCTNGSFFTGLTSSVVGGVRGIPFVYNVQDLYPETPVNAGQLTSRRAIAILERLEKYMYRKAAHNTVIAPSFRESLVAKGVPPKKVSVIPNFADTDFIRPLPKDNPFSRNYGLTEKFVVTHAGNIGYVYDLATLLDAATCLRDDPKIHLLIVGEGVAKPGLEKKAEERRLENVTFLGFQPRESLPWLRAASDVQVSLYRPGAARYSMPSKIYEIMASGRPVLASADPSSDVWNLVKSNDCGLCVEPERPDQLADAIRALAHTSERREAMGSRGRQIVLEQYSAKVVTQRYEEILRAVVSSSDGS